MSITQKWRAYQQLMRLDKPIGTYLLLWPTLSALWLAAEGLPNLDILIIFVVGVIVMRAAGCIINDYADRDLDGHVERTQQRPLAEGLVAPREALGLFLSLCMIAFGLVLFTNTLTISLSFVAVVLAAIYPFMKRFTQWPQLFLGMAFSWAIPMAFAAQMNSVPLVAWLFFVAVVLQTIAYDTYYAMVDRDDDIKVGIKSTAILFGQWDRQIIAMLQIGTVSLLVAVGVLAQLGVSYYCGLGVMSVLFIYQYISTRLQDKASYFKAFLNNHWATLALWLGLVVTFL